MKTPNTGATTGIMSDALMSETLILSHFPIKIFTNHKLSFVKEPIAILTNNKISIIILIPANPGDKKEIITKAIIERPVISKI